MLICLQYNVVSHDAIRHKWSGPNNGECCCVDDGDVGERHPIRTALDGGHTACIALGGAASVVSHQTEEVEGGGGGARDCSLKVGSTVYHCGLRCSNRRSSARRPHRGYKGLLLHWAGQVEAIPSEGSVCLQKQPLETALQLELCVCMLIANVCGSFEVREGGQGDIDIRMTIYLLLTKLQCANGGWWPHPLTTNSRRCYMYIYVDQICGY